MVTGNCVFRTNVQGAFSDGQMAVLHHPLVRSGFPYSAYDAIHDDRVRPDHLALEKLGIGGTNVYRNDDPVFQTFRPPWDYNDRCGWTPITVRQAAERGVAEARAWLDNSVEPSPPAHVPMPKFAPPPGFQRALASAPLSIQLSMQSMSVFEDTKSDKPDDRQHPLTQWTKEDYPRDKAKRFIDKHTIVDAAADQATLAELRESVPEDQRHKLDRAVGILQAGGTIHHPDEAPGLGINASGEIPNSAWADYALAKAEHEEWIERDAERTACRKCASKAVKLLRKAKVSLDDVDRELEDAGATGVEMRTLARVRHRFNNESISQRKLDNLYERVCERINRRLDKETRQDVEPDAPEEPPTVAAGAAFATGGKWITIGGHPEGKEKHVGGFRVQIDERGDILKGRMRGSKVQNVKSNFDRMKGRGTHAGRQQLIAADRAGVAARRAAESKAAGPRPVGRAVRPDGSQPDATSGQVGGAPPRPGDETISQVGTDKNQPASNQPDSNAGQAQAKGRKPADTTGVNDKARVASLYKVNRRIRRYIKVAKSKGDGSVAEWFKELHSHVNEVGVEKALEELGPEMEAGPGVGRVQYKSTAYQFNEGPDQDAGLTRFVGQYLDRAGITLMTGARDENLPVYAGAPVPSARAGMKPGDVVPLPTDIEDKLQEAKTLPGLETTEDIDVICGKTVDQITPDVIAKLDAKYGKDSKGKSKWIIKTYGEEAYAGFGVFFPPKLDNIKQNAKADLAEVADVARKSGMDLHKDDQGNTTGFIDPATQQVYPFTDKHFPVPKPNNTESLLLQQNRMLRLARVGAIAAKAENGARLPRTPEENLRQSLGIGLIKGASGKVIGYQDSVGQQYKFGTPEWEKHKETMSDALEHEIERATYSAENPAPEGAVRYMVSPAFESVGVTDAERAMGYTWETGQEGRVHVTIDKDGKAHAIPGATLATRHDAIPIVFYNDDMRAMERAAEEAMMTMPKASRMGRVFAPDVMKTPDGWRVVERNASAEEGSSLWLEQNPMVIDAYVSHLTGREPMHVQFIRNLLRERIGGSRTSDRSKQSEAWAKEKPIEGTLVDEATGRPTSDAQEQEQAERDQGVEVGDLLPPTPDAEPVSTAKAAQAAPNTPAAQAATKVHAQVEEMLAGNARYNDVEELLDRMDAVLDDPSKIALAQTMGAGTFTSGREAMDAVQQKAHHDYLKRRHGTAPRVPEMERGSDRQEPPSAEQLDEHGRQERFNQNLNSEYDRQREFNENEVKPGEQKRRRQVNEEYERQRNFNPSEDARQLDFDPKDPLGENRRQAQFNRRRNVRLSADFEAEHPREPKGTEAGGEFKKGGKRSAGYGIATVKLGRLKVSYSLHKSSHVPKGGLQLQNYKQHDIHSCGFVAALTIARYFKEGTSAKEVLKAVRPSVSHGVDRYNLIASLKKLGIKPTYKKNLTIPKLRRYIKQGIPVIVSVWPENWFSDHWTVVRAIDDKYVYLTNHSRLPIRFFRKQWSDMDMRGQGGSGEGIICEHRPDDSSSALSTDAEGHEHKGKGVGGGQFTGKGEGDSGGKRKPSKRTHSTAKTPKEEWKFSDEVPPHNSWKDIEADPDYVYHASNQDNAASIQESGMRPHNPWYGTKQGAWPDGSTAKRVYFTDKPATAWQFAPEEGKPVLLRMRRREEVKTESTGDLYVEGKKIPPRLVEILTSEGWKPLKSAAP